MIECVTSGGRKWKLDEKLAEVVFEKWVEFEANQAEPGCVEVLELYYRLSANVKYKLVVKAKLGVYRQSLNFWCDKWEFDESRQSWSKINKKKIVEKTFSTSQLTASQLNEKVREFSEDIERMMLNGVVFCLEEKMVFKLEGYLKEELDAMVETHLFDKLYVCVSEAEVWEFVGR